MTPALSNAAPTIAHPTGWAAAAPAPHLPVPDLLYPDRPDGWPLAGPAADDLVSAELVPRPHPNPGPDLCQGSGAGLTTDAGVDRCAVPSTLPSEDLSANKSADPGAVSSSDLAVCLLAAFPHCPVAARAQIVAYAMANGARGSLSSIVEGYATAHARHRQSDYDRLRSLRLPEVSIACYRLLVGPQIEEALHIWSIDGLRHHPMWRETARLWRRRARQVRRRMRAAAATRRMQGAVGTFWLAHAPQEMLAELACSNAMILDLAKAWLLEHGHPLSPEDRCGS